jgi:hypothetical protein
MKWRGIGVCLVLGCSGAQNTGLQGPGSDASSNEDTGIASDTGAADTSKPDGKSDMDAGMDVVQPPIDSGPATSTIHCGNSSCTSPNETCCRQQNNFNCTGQNGCGGGLSILCEKRQNCESLGLPGTVCCGHYSLNQLNQAIVDKIACTAPANCTQQLSSVVLCDPNDPSQCLQGQTCTLSTISIPGYYFCK